MFVYTEVTEITEVHMQQHDLCQFTATAETKNGVLTVRQNRCVPCSASSVAVVLSKLNGSPFTEAKGVEKS